MWLYIAFFQVFLSSSTSKGTATIYNSQNMCICKTNIDDYKKCNNAWTKKVVEKSKSLNDFNTCMDMMWMIVNIDPFWSFSNLTDLKGINSVENYPFNHSAIGHALKASCWPTISHYLYEYKKNYSVQVGDRKFKEPLYLANIKKLSNNRIIEIIKQCNSEKDSTKQNEKCKKIGLYLVLDILHPELLGRPSWFLTLLDPNSAKTQLAFLRNKVPNPGQNEYLKMYNNFVDRIVPKDTEIFPVVKNCNNSMDIANKSLCYIQSIRTVFDLGANVDIQHYHIHDMVTGKRLSALKTNYAICDDKSNSSSADNLCGTGYSGYINSLTLQYLEMENANLVVTNNTTKTNENILTYMRGRANYEFWQKLKSTK